MSTTREGTLPKAAWAPAAARRTGRLSLGFFGIAVYLVCDYTRLAAMYPALQSVHVAKIAILLTGIGYLLSPARGATSKAVRTIDLALGVFLLVSFLSTCFAHNVEHAWDVFFDILRWVIVYFLIGRIVNSPWRLRAFTILYLLLNLKLAQFGIRVYLSGGGLVGGLAQAGAGSTGFFSNSNDFGTAMAIVFPVPAALLLWKTKKVLRLLMVLCFAAFSGALLLSGCRGAFVGATIAVVVGSMRSGKKAMGVVMAGLLALGVVYLLPQANRERLRSALDWERDKTAELRVNLWKAGLRMWEDHPLLGVGPNNFGTQYKTLYSASDPHPFAWAPHSIYIQGLAELGLLGTAPLIVIWTYVFVTNARTRKQLLAAGLSRGSFEVSLSLGLDFAFLAYLVSGAFLTILYYPHQWFLMGMTVGLSAASAEIARNQEAKTELLEKQRLAVAMPVPAA